MATRAYRRDSRGRFAGGGGGTRVTYGRAGGFKAGNTFGARSRVAGNARSTGRGNRSALRGATFGARAPVRRLRPVTSQRAYRANVSRIRTAQRRNSNLGLTGVGITLGGAALVAQGLSKPGRGRDVLGGAIATGVGIRVMQRAGRRSGSLSAQLGSQTRQYRRIKGAI